MYDELTAKDIQKMEEEIEYRKLVVRKQALEDVKEARAHGDLSENFEYKAAKKFKNENEKPNAWQLYFLPYFSQTAFRTHSPVGPHRPVGYGLLSPVSLRLCKLPLTPATLWCQDTAARRQWPSPHA